MRSTWKIINEENGKARWDTGINSFVIDNKLVINQNKIANAFNKHFLSIADSVISDI
jgi:hypothetical protein